MTARGCTSPVHASAVALVEEALLLRMYGERPPGAPRGNPQAETWAYWEMRAEALARAMQEFPPRPPGPLALAAAGVTFAACTVFTFTVASLLSAGPLWLPFTVSGAGNAVIALAVFRLARRWHR